MALVRWRYKTSANFLVSGIFVVWICSLYLQLPKPNRTKENLLGFRKSKLHAVSSVKNEPPVTCKNRKLKLSTKPLPRIVLASFPESGGEWIQNLLEEVTGFVSVNTLCKNKTNDVSKYCSNYQYAFTYRTYNEIDTYNNYQKAVIIIRSPYTAITALFNENLLKVGKRGQARTVQYRKTFSNFMWTNSEKWINVYASWLNFTGDKIIILYDELLANPRSMVQVILNLADIKESDLELNCWDEVSWKPRNQLIVNQKQLAMLTIDFRKNVESKIREFEKKISLLRNETVTLHRDV